MVDVRTDEQHGYAGVDVGGSGIRVRVNFGTRSAERRLSEAVPRVQGRVDETRLCRRVLELLRPAMFEAGVTCLAGLGIGMTGIPGLVEHPELIARHLSQQEDLGKTAIASDALTTHLGALEGRAGAVVAAGTGVATLGTNFDTIWNQVDGWGALIGDEGSGAWVGKMGLNAALRSWDSRRGGSQGLRMQMEAQFGGPHTLVEHIYSSTSPAAVLGSFTPAVEKAANAGDCVAKCIWNQAGRHLAHSVIAATRGVSLRISWGGGLFRVGDLLLEPFKEEVSRALPEAGLHSPAGGSIDGSLLLAQRAFNGSLGEDAPYVYVFSP